MSTKPDPVDSIDDLLERSIATANLLAVAEDHQGAELADGTIKAAAFHLYRDLQQIQCKFAALTDTDTPKQTAA